MVARVDATASGQGQLSDNSPVFFVLFFFSPADGLPALSFSISSLTLIGMLAVITYTVSCAHQCSICTVIKTKHSMGSSPNLDSMLLNRFCAQLRSLSILILTEWVWKTTRDKNVFCQTFQDVSLDMVWLLMRFFLEGFGCGVLSCFYLCTNGLPSLYFRCTYKSSVLSLLLMPCDFRSQLLRMFRPLIYNTLE